MDGAPQHPHARPRAHVVADVASRSRDAPGIASRDRVIRIHAPHERGARDDARLTSWAREMMRASRVPAAWDATHMCETYHGMRVTVRG